MAYRILEEKCVGCGACAWVCLFGAPMQANENGSVYRVDDKKCVSCGHCEEICPNSAIRPDENHRPIRKVTIDPEKCVGCSVCEHVCPEKAPHGKLHQPFEIDQEKCFQCGACAVRCHHDAIQVEYVEKHNPLCDLLHGN